MWHMIVLCNRNNQLYSCHAMYLMCCVIILSYSDHNRNIHCNHQHRLQESIMYNARIISFIIIYLLDACVIYVRHYYQWRWHYLTYAILYCVPLESNGPLVDALYSCVRATIIWIRLYKVLLYTQVNQRYDFNWTSQLNSHIQSSTIFILIIGLIRINLTTSE